MTNKDISKDWNLDNGSCCPSRVTVIGLDDKFVYFQTRDFIKHQMLIDEFEASAYRVN